MNSRFGDIELFKSALAENRLDPQIDDYLRSAGLTESEAAEVRDLFRTFCEAIDNASESRLPDIATGVQNPVNRSSVN